MFAELRRAWRQAVDNFWRELDAGSGAAPAATPAAYRELAAARGHVSRLDQELARSRHSLGEEREQVEVCERRRRMAAEIGDQETARVAEEYARRHRERAGVLARKVEVLTAERALYLRDLHQMERAVQAEARAAEAELDDLNRHPQEREFESLEDAERDRTAAERLAELKRRMG